MAYRRHTAPGEQIIQGRNRKPTRTNQGAAPRSVPGTRRPRRQAARVFDRARRPGLQFHWSDAISRSEWAIYRSAIRAVRKAGIPFLLGGGFAGATFTGRWRDTKDIDFYVHPRDRQATVTALTAAGFEDYFNRLPYDRKWIYRSVKSNVIVDIIWA